MGGDSDDDEEQYKQFDDLALGVRAEANSTTRMV